MSQPCSIRVYDDRYLHLQYTVELSASGSGVKFQTVYTYVQLVVFVSYIFRQSYTLYVCGSTYIILFLDRETLFDFPELLTLPLNSLRSIQRNRVAFRNGSSASNTALVVICITYCNIQ
jgi:hypothetical protein